jgi:hypothetical protein
MSLLEDDKGKKSLMRIVTLLIVVTALLWGTIEVVYSLFNNDFNIHVTLILSVLGVGVTGKLGQKIAERIKK